MTINTRIVNRFSAESKSGKVYQIIVLQDFIDGYPAYPNGEIPGATEYRTDNNLHVEVINYTTFRIVESDEIVKRLENDKQGIN
jgi:hypothetical protein